jgi:hypothetical protein
MLTVTCRIFYYVPHFRLLCDTAIDITTAFVTLKPHKVSQYVSKCNTKNTALPVPIFTKFTDVQERYVRISYTEYRRRQCVKCGQKLTDTPD